MNAYANAATGIGSSLAGVQQPREMTLNERLNRAMENAQGQCNRIESVLARVNGTPQAVDSINKAQTAPQFPLGAAVEQAEILAQRLGNLANSIEQIA